MEELSTEVMFCLDIGRLCESNEVSEPPEPNPGR